MIDWATVILPFEHPKPIEGGRIMIVNPEGELEWEAVKGLKIPGSYESSVQVKTSAGSNLSVATHLWISGNPVKFLTGQNVIGSDDLCRLVALMARRLLTHLGYEVSAEQFKRWREGDFVLKTVDINYMRHCGSRANARAMLKLAQHSGCMRRSGRGEFTGTTLYFAKHSKRRAIKMYVKGDELEHGGKKHQLTALLPADKRETLLAIADNALRIELRLMALELKALGLQKGRVWRKLDVRELFNSYIERIQFSANQSISRRSLLAIPRHLQRTYALWNEGIDIRGQLTQATYYRHRRELLRLSIDIGATRISPGN